MASVAPAVILGCLGFAQISDALGSLTYVTSNPSWPIVIQFARELTYGAFVLAAAVVLWKKRIVRARDARWKAAAVSLTGSFLLVGARFVPAGPVVWSGSLRTSAIGLLVTAVGSILALAALSSLKWNFSIIPEVRLLVVSGPYRWLRHPMYFAELLMIVGLALGGLRIVYLVGALCVLGLQIYRIRLEEQLLSSTFPKAHQEFVTRTRFRLIPFVW